MPHRTVFQWGKNHAHPFTMFVGGFVVGTLVTGAAAWAWAIAEDTDQVDNVVTGKRQNAAPTSSPEAFPTVTPASSPAVTF